MAQVKTVSPDGPRIRALRLEAGLTAEQLASKIPGRHAQTIRRIERGAIPASEVLIHQIAKALQTKAAELIQGSNGAAA